VNESYGQFLERTGGGRPAGPGTRAMLFLIVFFGLQWAYGLCGGTGVQRLLIEAAVVKPAAALVNALEPGVAAVAVGTELRSPGGGLNILAGCEGTEILFMLAAVFSICGLPLAARLRGLLYGILLVFVLNEVRIVVLFHAARSGKTVFDLLHTLVAPSVMVLAVAGYIYAWLYRFRPLRTRRAAEL